MIRISYIGVVAGVLAIILLLFISHIYYPRENQSSLAAHQSKR